MGKDFRSRSSQIAGQEIYHGTLEKGNDKLSTAWWYTDGTTVTIDQWTWRSQALVDGKAFYLVNVTTGSEATLIRQVTAHFAGQSFAIQPAQ